MSERIDLTADSPGEGTDGADEDIDGDGDSRDAGSRDVASRDASDRFVTRRQVLSVLGSAIAAGVAGCGGRSGSDGFDGSRPPETWPSAAKDAHNSRYAPDGSPPDRRKIAWRAPIDSVDRFPPIVTETGVFVLSRDTFRGFDRDGTERWSLSLGDDEFVGGAPTAIPGWDRIALGNGAGRLRLIDAETGRVAAERTYAEGIDAAVVAPARDRELYVTTERGRIHALGLGSDGLTTRWTHDAFGGVDHAPAVGERIVVGTTAGVECLDHGGYGRWRRDLSDPVVTRPTLAGDLVLVGTRGHVLHAFDVETGERLWHRTIIKNAHAGESIEGVAATPDSIYVTDSRAVHALTRHDGRRRWRHHDWERSFGPPVAVDGAVLVADGDGLSAFDPDGGPGFGSLRPDPVRWRFVPEGSPRGLAVVGDRTYLTVARADGDVLLELR
ncbi:PQQ-binding-like beta-propeller repeat protein [Salinigranum sp. GCM10025319]|uniref:outer membrane protein assembly factor BamB family protein n=1 Tax=Salinigranum sp. GCM10025319 TaxID=3252687 RepID=UPI0036193747